MKVTDQNFYMDGYLHNSLQFGKKSVYNDDDLILLLDGMERSGKSVFAQQIGYFLDPKFNLDKIVFRVEDFQHTVKTAEKYSCIVWDEAFRGLSKRQAISKINKQVVQTLMEVGQRNLFIIIVLPTFFELDKYAALHRCKALIHVVRNDEYKRGFFKFYNYKKMKEMYVKGRQEYKYCVKCNFFGRFTNHYTLPEDKYREKKNTELQEADKEILEDTPNTKAMRDRDVLLKYTYNMGFPNVRRMIDDIRNKYPEFTLKKSHIYRVLQEKPSFHSPFSKHPT